MLKGLLKTKLFDQLKNLLKQGLTPSELALVFSIGFSLGLFPVLGIHALICTGVALLFRLNLIAIQVAHSLAFPFQIFLFIPFLRFGEMVIGKELGTISKDMIFAAFNEGLLYTFQVFSEYLLFACLGWLLLITPIFFIIYLPLLKIVQWFFIKSPS